MPQPQHVQIVPTEPQVIDNEQEMTTVAAEFETAPEMDLTTDQMREELNIFLVSAKDELFTSIGKNRGVMLAAVITEKDDAKIRRQYRWMISMLKGQK
jgi:dsDNA-binding SOS-regulon protein